MWPRPAWRDLALPVGLAALQLLVWPVVPWLTGESVDRGQVGLLLAVTVVVATLLCWRQKKPLTVLVAAVVVLSLAWLRLPERTLMVIGFADLVALYSAAVHRTVRPVIVVSCTAFVSQIAVQAVVAPDVMTAVLVLIPVGLLYALVAVLGRARRRWRAGRDAVAAQLAHRDDRERYAAAAERARLARELHDVSAHHLSTIVVHGQAAARLAERAPDDPELEQHLTQTLAFAADTARQTLVSLRQLVTVIDLDTDGGDPRRSAPDLAEDELADPPSLAGIAALAEGFTRLGQTVTVATEGAARDVPAEVAAAGHRIAQEALTNALRYAPGAFVRIQLRYQLDQVELVVSDDGATAPRSGGRGASGLGSGRGIAGMRERVEALGGSLAAGARPEGGWTVRAVLPTGTPAKSHRAPAATGSEPRSRGHATERSASDPPLWSRVPPGLVLDAILTGFAVAILAITMTAVAAEPAGRAVLGPPMSIALLIPLIALQVVPILWRRRSPWLALFVSIGAALLWLPLVAVSAIPADSVILLVAAWWIDFVMVYTVAVQRAPAWLTWLAVLATATMENAVQVVPAVLRGDDRDVFDMLVMVGVSAAALSLAWGLGTFVRLRRTRTLRREGAALAELAASAEAAVRAERNRIAHGLQGSVLAHTDRLIDIARDDRTGGDCGGAIGRVTAIVAEARAALTAMRELLTVLRAADEPLAGSPQPTVAGIGELCRRRRTAGEQITLTVDGDCRPLAVEVELSAFRVVEAALDGRVRGLAAVTPARAVTVSYGREHLRVQVAGLPAGSETVFDELRGRVDAVGGVLTVRAGEGKSARTRELHAWFPASGDVPG